MECHHPNRPRISWHSCRRAPAAWCQLLYKLREEIRPTWFELAAKVWDELPFWAVENGNVLIATAKFDRIHHRKGRWYLRAICHVACRRVATCFYDCSKRKSTHAAVQNSVLNVVAPWNVSSMPYTLDTSHLEMSLLNDFASWNMSFMLLTRDTSHPEMSPLNDVALRNMRAILVTLDTSQLDKGPLDDRVNENMASMLVTLTR